jgi:ferric-dicitrate binding protein FerR (iron transport regulator)
VERVLNPGTETVALPLPHVRPSVAGALTRLRPLWRHAAWLVAFGAVIALAVAVRLDFQQMRKDYERTSRAQREALILQDRLRLELDARRRASAMEALAVRHGLVDHPAVVNLRGKR